MAVETSAVTGPSTLLPPLQPYSHWGHHVRSHRDRHVHYHRHTRRRYDHDDDDDPKEQLWDRGTLLIVWETWTESNYEEYCTIVVLPCQCSYAVYVEEEARGFHGGFQLRKRFVKRIALNLRGTRNGIPRSLSRSPNTFLEIVQAGSERGIERSTEKADPREINRDRVDSGSAERSLRTKKAQ
ncbi:hypothetical protein BGY98DRAFT_1175302 [Russula aff. rugulosa BPL654]|nr:hypothetical protein BGY98DRAFT_1175302 [Russula aff. rugulosa BPL654]